jgi:Na+-translocating ferredoxin:NAD+ oxidoreductase subunit B
MLVAILVVGLLASGLGLLLGYAAIRFHVESDPVADMVDELLPQSQCGQCGYAGCRPYAEAVAAGVAEINMCVPGGAATVRAIAELLGKELRSADAEQGDAAPKMLAVIDESLCIGCTLCIQACPVDAIVGAPKQMHTVIAKECTGCDLCPPVCPVDCIRMEPVRDDIRSWKWPDPRKQIELADGA